MRLPEPLHRVTVMLWQVVCRAGSYAWKAGYHPKDSAPGSDWAAWTLRMVLLVVLLCWAVPPLVRPNIPLIFPSYSAFDDAVPFNWWGYGGLAVVLLLWLIPTRYPLGLISTGVAMFYLYLVGAMFQHSAGLLYSSILFRVFGLLSGLLFMRSLWKWAENWGWFRERVMREPPHGR